ncbi:hypothetical protein ACLB2K_021712 [Fragaria x ananassa]
MPHLSCHIINKFLFPFFSHLCRSLCSSASLSLCRTKVLTASDLFDDLRLRANDRLRHHFCRVTDRIPEEDEALRFGVPNPHHEQPPTPRLGVLFNLSYSEESPAPSPTSDGAATFVLGKDDSYLYETGRIVAGDRLAHLNVTYSKLHATIWDISAPNLSSLEYHPHSHESFSIEALRLSRIVFSYKKLEKTLPHALIEFASCPQLKTLHLQMPADIRQSSSIPAYGNLKQLHLEIDLDLHFEDEDDPYGELEDDPYSPFVSDVQDLLKAAPLLEELIIIKLLKGPA